MKNIYTLLLVVLCFCATQAQTVEEMKAMKAEKAAQAAELQGQVNALNADIAGLQNKIDIAGGWKTGISGLIGFGLNNSNKWIANPNPKSTTSSLNLGLTGLANLKQTKYFWNNKLIVSKAWQDIDLDNEPSDGLLDNSNSSVDILNLTSLIGYNIHPKLAISGLGEINTSLGNFFKPGTVDIGAGVTWLPIPNMTVVVHPLNYNIKFPADGLAIETTGTIGAKVRVDYARDFLIANKKFSWSSTLSSFVPYTEEKVMIEDTFNPGTVYEAGSLEYTWLNTVAFEIWRGIGVGVGFGFRQAKFETKDVQSFTSVGLSYGF